VHARWALFIKILLRRQHVRPVDAALRFGGQQRRTRCDRGPGGGGRPRSWREGACPILKKSSDRTAPRAPYITRAYVRMYNYTYIYAYYSTVDNIITIIISSVHD